MSGPPVPTRLTHRPTQGGLVVPWISVELANGSFDLGNMHNTRVNTCFMERRCQICGDPIGRTVLFFLSTKALADRIAGEPPLHPECAAYSKLACPMVAGQMTHYRKTPTRTAGHVGKTCPTPGCDCGGWVSTPGNGQNAGRPAEAWHMVWCHTYDIAVPDKETLRLVNRGVVPAGARLRARITRPVKVRAVSPPP